MSVTNMFVLLRVVWHGGMELCGRVRADELLLPEDLHNLRALHSWRWCSLPDACCLPYPWATASARSSPDQGVQVVVTYVEKHARMGLNSCRIRCRLPLRQLKSLILQNDCSNKGLPSAFTALIAGNKHLVNVECLEGFAGLDIRLVFFELKTLRNGFRYICFWDLIEDLSSRFMMIGSCLLFSNEPRYLLEMIHLQKMIWVFNEENVCIVS